METKMLKDTNTVVVGAGLMGGSILKALKKNPNRPKKVTALDIDTEVLKKIAEQNLADTATCDVADALSDADFVVISLYPAQTIKFVKANIKYIKKGCVVMDICGVKREVLNAVPKMIPEGISYISTHPMAGREHKGFDYSVEDLFTNCKYIVDEHDEVGKDLVIEFANTLGAGKIVESSPLNHDEMIAYTSQLPHVLAVAYMLCAGERNVEEFSAGSFRDVTRVAMINEVMWSELFCENKDMLLKEVASLIRGLEELEENIENCDVDALREKMRKAAAMREAVTE